MSTLTTGRHPGAQAKRYPSTSFYGKLRKRGIIAAFAAVVGSGWFVYEIVHFVLVDHYHLPDRLNDVAIVGVLCALFCILTWRWFRSQKRKRRIKWELVFIPIFVLVAAVMEGRLILHLRGDSKESGGDVIRETDWKNSVAILPFVNMSADQEQEYFCDGLTEELITKLSQIRELKVAARTSAFVFKGKSADIREVGQRLGVGNVLEGSVRKGGSRIRVSAQLISVADGYHLWSENYDRHVDDILAVQDEIARSVAQTLQVTLLGETSAAPETKNTEAYDAFLLGNYFYRQQDRESLGKAVSYYEQAIKLDPGFARAWAGLGACHAFQAGSGYVPSKEGYERAKLAVKNALALDRNLAFALRVHGWIQMSCDWDWAGAEASYKRAMSLEPQRGQVEMAQLAVAQGRFETAVSLARRAVELDPISVQPYATLGLAYWYGGRPEEAVGAYRKILELIPDYPAMQALIGLVRLTQSNPQEAIAILDRVKDPFWRLQGMAMVYHSQGKAVESDAALAEFIEKYQAGGAYNIAQVYAYRGEAGLAFQWLDRAYAQHDGGIFLCNVDPFLKDLRGDSRFKSLTKKMHLAVTEPTSDS